MTRYHSLLLLLLTVTFVACHSTGAPAHRTASLNQEMQLAPGEQAVFSQHGLTLEFVRVVEDSRCPTDTTCVWAGEVKVQLSIRNNAAEAVKHEITAGHHATVGEFRVIVVQVHPEPISTRTIAPDEYLVTIRVEHAPR
jgi:hypothetical protein